MSSTPDIDYHESEDREGNVLDRDRPMVCHHCGRPSLYDYADSQYHHAIDAATGCFLIPAEQRPDDEQHPLMRPWNPVTDAKACSACKSEDVTDTATMRPSGIAPMIRCANGHVTNGMPTAAYFEGRVQR